jgi:hypothetical protein
MCLGSHSGTLPLPSWSERNDEIAGIARRQLFFIGGAPRSGTTWLQQMLDCHPDVSCKGEGLFLNHFATPLEKLVAERRKVLQGKNTGLFRHTGGYPLPAADDTEFLIGSAILAGLRQQCAGKPYLAVGEKTPENVFLFERLQRLFPDARFVAIARDPRDAIASAWHFFHKPRPGEDAAAAKTAFIRNALPSMNAGAKAMLAFRDKHPAATQIVTYEALRRAPSPVLASLFRLLGVSERAEIIGTCLARTAFVAQTGGRHLGVEQNGAFFRKGVVGDWPATLTPEMDAMVRDELGWMFPLFGWQA